MKKRQPARRHEFTDPNPMTLPVKFQKPPTLAEQIARYMGAHDRYQDQGEESPEEADDFGDDDEDEPRSPHELVFDPLLNREIPVYEKILLDKGRAKFEAELAEKVKADKAAAAATQQAKKLIAAEQQKQKKERSAPPSEPVEDDN